MAPDSYLYPSNFTAVTNLAIANVQVYIIQVKFFSIEFISFIKFVQKKVTNVGQVYESSQSLWTIDVELSTDMPAAFVWLDTITDRKGRFSDNAFLMSTPTKTVSFWSSDPITDSTEFFVDLQVTHLAQIIR